MNDDSNQNTPLNEEPTSTAQPPTSISIEDRINNAVLADLQNIINDVAQVSSETIRAVYIDKIKKKFSIPQKTIEKDIETIRGSGKPDKGERIMTADFPELVDIATDVDKNVVFLVKITNFIGTDYLQIFSEWSTGEVTYIPPKEEHLPFQLPRAEKVIEWFSKGKDNDLFIDVFNYFGGFSHLSTEQKLVLTAKVFLTYIQDHPQIHYLPYILLYAEPVRGKSRTGKASIYICYRGVHLVSVQQASIFRLAENLHASLFLDLKNAWQSIKEGQAQDILLTRFEKGAKVPRVMYPERGPFEDTKYFNVYGPTFIASNDAIHKILDTRCIHITMANKPGNYENPVPKFSLELKERLTSWRARMMGAPLPEIENIDGVGGRLWDISRPLLQICGQELPQGYGHLVKYLQWIANEKADDISKSFEGEIVSALRDLSPTGLTQWSTGLETLLNFLNEGRPEEFELSSAPLGKKLKAMGFKTDHKRGYSTILMEKVEFDTFLKQYGIDPTPQKKDLKNTALEQVVSNLLDTI